MKVLMLKSFSGPYASYRKGEVYDLPDSKALRWLRDKCASPVRQEKTESNIIPVESEEIKLKAEQLFKDQQAETERLAKEAEDKRLEEERILKEKAEEDRIKAEKKAKSDAAKLKAKEKREKATVKAEETAVTDVQANNTTVKRTAKPARGKRSSKGNNK